MVQSPSWEGNWFAACQEIPRIPQNPKVHYRTHKRPPPVSIMGQPNPVHIHTSHLLQIHPNIIHPSTPRSPQLSLYLRFPHQDPIHPPLLTHTLMHIHKIVYIKTFKIVPKCFDPKIIFRLCWGITDVNKTVFVRNNHSTAVPENLILFFKNEEKALLVKSDSGSLTFLFHIRGSQRTFVYIIVAFTSNCYKHATQSNHSH